MATDISEAPRATATRVETQAIALVKPRDQPLDWKMTSAFVALHAGALLALLPEFFSWKAVFTFLGLQALGGLMSNIAMHRLISHRVYGQTLLQWWNRARDK